MSSIILVPRPGIEPRLTNYLLLTGYKSAVLPLNYRGIDWLRRLDSNQRFLAYETKRIDHFHTPLLIGRSTRIRTLDPLVPNQVRYQTALHSELFCLICYAFIARVRWVYFIRT